MDLARRDVSSARMTEAKWWSVRKCLSAEPYTVLAAKTKRDAPPEAFVLSTQLLDILLDKTEKLDSLVGSDEFQALKAENRKLRGLLEAILGKLQQTGKLQIDNETWRLVRHSIFDTLGPDTNLEDGMHEVADFDEAMDPSYRPIWTDPGAQG